MYLAPCFNNLHGADVIAINFTEDDVRKFNRLRRDVPRLAIVVVIAIVIVFVNVHRVR